jgi:L-asparaginase
LGQDNHISVEATGPPGDIDSPVPSPPRNAGIAKGFPVGDISRPSVVILSVGGTIAGMADSADKALSYQAATIPVGSLVDAVPSLRDQRLDLEQVAQLDSKDMDHATWRLLATRIAHHLARPEVGGIVVLHGTDTLEETSYFLHRVLSPQKPVVLTAAMRPSNALLADGHQNLLDAVCLAQDHAAKGVMLCLLGQVYAPDDIRKAHGYHLDAFRSGGSGIIGSTVEGNFYRVRDWPECVPFGQENLPDIAAWPKVAVFMSHAGVHGASLDALLESGIDGLVIAGTGNGTIHRSLEAPIRGAQQRGIVVWRASRCLEGGVVGDGDLPSTGRLSAVQGRIELMLRLMSSESARP